MFFCCHDRLRDDSNQPYHIRTHSRAHAIPTISARSQTLFTASNGACMQHPLTNTNTDLLLKDFSVIIKVIWGGVLKQTHVFANGVLQSSWTHLENHPEVILRFQDGFRMIFNMISGGMLKNKCNCQIVLKSSWNHPVTILKLILKSPRNFRMISGWFSRWFQDECKPHM